MNPRSLYTVILAVSLFLISHEGNATEEPSSMEIVDLAEEELWLKQRKRADAFHQSLLLVRELDTKFKGWDLFEELLKEDPSLAVKISEIWTFRVNVYSRNEVKAQEERFKEREITDGMSRAEITARIFVFLTGILDTARTAYFHEHRSEIEEMIGNALQ